MRMSEDPAGIESTLTINRVTCEWTVRAISTLEKVLGVNIRLHQDECPIGAGQIFLLNHFARFETFIPQFLIYKETGTLIRSIAHGEFFAEDDGFANYLKALGAVPHDMPGLLPFLAAEVLRGRKLVVFPEGGMVKDRRVIDGKGRYGTFSRTANERRKHHTGAAVLALTLEAFKIGILAAEAANHRGRLERMTEALGLATVESLLAAARQPTLIVPANITFYPIRVDDNILKRGVELFNKGLSKRLAEELLIEGNLLLKDTDMDMRLGTPIPPADYWNWWERRLLARVVERVDSLDRLFELSPWSGPLIERFAGFAMRRKVLRVRDAYMRGMYAGVTLNMSHLASRLMLELVERGHTEVERGLFHRTLYLAIKNAQAQPAIHLHRSLKNPRTYGCLLDGGCPGFEQFISSSAAASLVEKENGAYRFLPKLCQEHEFDEVRLENLISVYANEMAPIAPAMAAVKRAADAAPAVDERALAGLRFDDELAGFAWDKARFSKPRHAKINDQETAGESGEPYLLIPDGGSRVGVVLVHGFLASPAELRDFGARLFDAGYAVMGVRLRGHGTSPWDLRERSWHDWLDSVRRGHRIMAALCGSVCLVGFSSGGALALCLAAERSYPVAGVVAVSAPMKFRNKNLIFVPLMHRANQVASWVPALEGIMPFRPNDSEHPHINYRNIPMRGLFELRRMVDGLRKRLANVDCPVSVIQGTEDQVVDAKSADMIMAGLGTAEKNRTMIPSRRHGILNEDIGETQDAVLSFLAALQSGGSVPSS
jgi:esterase/lipase